MKNETRPLVEVDQRGRISVRKWADATLYLLDKEPDGTIVLTPATVVPATAKGAAAS